MENSEVIQKLMEYLEKQPIEVVYRLCANCMLDLHRVNMIGKGLTKQEKESLLKRIKFNSEGLQNFLKGEYSDKLTLGSLD